MSYVQVKGICDRFLNSISLNSQNIVYIICDAGNLKILKMLTSIFGCRLNFVSTCLQNSQYYWPKFVLSLRLGDYIFL